MHEAYEYHDEKNQDHTNSYGAHVSPGILEFTKMKSVTVWKDKYSRWVGVSSASSLQVRRWLGKKLKGEERGFVFLHLRV